MQVERILRLETGRVGAAVLELILPSRWLVAWEVLETSCAGNISWHILGTGFIWTMDCKGIGLPSNGSGCHPRRTLASGRDNLAGAIGDVVLNVWDNKILGQWNIPRKLICHASDTIWHSSIL